MYASFTSQDRKGNVNSSSCKMLANYLDKEIKNEWFNENANTIKTDEIVSEIDRNGKGQLGKEDWKFAEVEYNPSQKEQQIIIERATGRNDITDWNQLSTEEQLKTKNEFKKYVQEAQTEQAKNYNRDNINSSKDLKWYGKIETERKHKGYDEEVKKGNAKSGEKKPGLQMHCHIIQSRKGSDQKTKLSPLSKHKKQTDKNSIQQGFDRNKFYNSVDDLFDRKYEYKRSLEEKFEYQKAKKFNRKSEIQILEKQEFNLKTNNKMKTLEQQHYELSQRNDIETFNDYKNAMEQQQVSIREIKNQKNETIDLELKSKEEKVKFTELQEEIKLRENEEIKSRWIKEQDQRQDQLRAERENSEKIREEQRDKNNKGFGI